MVAKFSGQHVPTDDKLRVFASKQSWHEEVGQTTHSETGGEAWRETPLPELYIEKVCVSLFVHWSLKFLVTLEEIADGSA